MQLQQRRQSVTAVYSMFTCETEQWFTFDRDVNLCGIDSHLIVCSAQVDAELLLLNVVHIQYGHNWKLSISIYTSCDTVFAAVTE